METDCLPIPEDAPEGMWLEKPWEDPGYLEWCAKQQDNPIIKRLLFLDEWEECQREIDEIKLRIESIEKVIGDFQIIRPLAIPYLEREKTEFEKQIAVAKNRRNNACKNRFINLLSEPLGSDQVWAIRIMVEQCSLRADLEEHFGEGLKDFTPKNFLEKLEDGSISQELFATLIEEYHQRFKQKEGEFLRVAHKAKEKLIALVEAGVANGTLPNNAAVAVNHIKSTRVILYDTLTIDSGSDRVLARCRVGNIVLVRNDVFETVTPDSLENTMFHEFQHVMQKKVLKKDGDFSVYFGVRRKRHDERQENKLFLDHALTEGLAEEFALKLSGYKGDSGPGAYKWSKYYPDERRLIDKAIESGDLNREWLLFQNYHHVALTRDEFIAAIDAKAEPGTAMKLENQYSMKAVREGLDIPLLNLGFSSNETDDVAEIWTFEITIDEGQPSEARKEFSFERPQPMTYEQARSLEHQLNNVLGHFEHVTGKNFSATFREINHEPGYRPKQKLYSKIKVPTRPAHGGLSDVITVLRNNSNELHQSAAKYGDDTKTFLGKLSYLSKVLFYPFLQRILSKLNV